MTINTNEQDTNNEIPQAEDEQWEKPPKGHGQVYFTAILEGMHKISQDPHIHRTLSGITVVKAASPLINLSTIFYPLMK